MAIASIRRIAAAASVAALLSVPSAVAVAPAADAQPPYPPTPGSLFLSTTAPAAGSPLFFVGTNYLPGEPVAAALTEAGFAPQRPDEQAQEQPTAPPQEGGPGGHRRLFRIVRADRFGTARGTLWIPRRIRPGRYLFSLTGLVSHQRLAELITVRSRHGYAGAPGGNGAEPAAGARTAAEPAQPGTTAQVGPAAINLAAAPTTGDAHPARPAGALTAAAAAAGGLAALGSGAWLLRRRRRERAWHA